MLFYIWEGAGNLGLLKSFFWYASRLFGASLVAQLVKNLPAMQATWVSSLGWEDTLDKGKATHFSILAWRIPKGGRTNFVCTLIEVIEIINLIQDCRPLACLLQFFCMYVWLSHLSSKPKLVCLTYSETKLTETLKFGAGKHLLKSHARRWFAHLSNPQPYTLWKISANYSWGQVRGGVAGFVISYCLFLIGGWWGNRMVSQGLTLSVLRLWEAWGYVLMVIR